MNEYFKEQLADGATEMFFYDDGSLVIERHRGSLETMTLNALVFDHMMENVPFFKLEARHEQEHSST